jgi:hypothetical protein
MLSIRNRTDNIPLLHFTRECAMYRYLYFIHREELWGCFGIETLTNMYAYDKTTLMLWQG